MFPFRYHRIGHDLIDEIHHKVSNNESVVLLGPRYGGKRHLMDRLQDLLERSQIEPVVRLRLLSETPVCTAASVAELMQTAIAIASRKSAVAEVQATGDPFASLKQFVKRTQKPVVLFAANVDGMSHHLAQRFLQEVQILAQERRLVAIMSGESDFRELVHGENSEFSCANQYVLQGFTLIQFRKFLSGHANYLRLEFADLEKASQHLWEVTGGNLYILRVMLWSIIQQRAQKNISPQDPVSMDEIPNTLKLIGIPGAYGAHIFRHATQLIARDQACWKELEGLMALRQVPVRPHEAPGRLELAGIATREMGEDVATLQFSSPMMRAFIERFYDDRRFGDLYANVGQWEEAFSRYRQLDPEERVRPSSIDDRAEVQATIGALCFSLYAEVASQGNDEKGMLQVDAVKRLFAQACHYVLGFREITFWQRDTLQQSPEWRLEPRDGFPPAKNIKETIESFLPSPRERNLRQGIIPSTAALSKFIVAAAMPSRLNKQLIVVVSDLTNARVVSNERKGFLVQVLHHFMGAYKHAVDVVNLQMRHRIRRQHDAIVDSIFEELGRPDFDVPDLLRKAATGLRQLDYSRVLFCLVDKERDAIIGVIDDSDNPAVNVAERTNWPLKNPTADVQPYVIHTRRPKIIKDARNEPLAAKEVVHAANMEAEAIVPILNATGEAVGTIHVERVDGAVPTQEEVDDLIFFGRQLAVAIEQWERLSLEGGAFFQHTMEASNLPSEAISTDSAIAKMLEAMAMLGHKWGRLYLVQSTENGDSIFVSKRWHGLKAEVGAEEDFNQGNVVLAPRSSGHRDWLCIEDKRPILYCWKDDLADGVEHTTDHGLKVLNWRKPDQPALIKKKPGDFWMDFPLIHMNQVLGKMCLQLDENLGRRHFESLKTFSANFSATLFANLQRDLQTNSREQMIKKSVADKTMATMAHNLGTRLGSLPVIYDRYCFMARTFKELQPLNDRFKEIIAHVQTSVKRANLVSPVSPRLKRVNLSDQISQVLKLNLPDNAWNFHCEGPEPFVELDAHLFETALLELIQNSRDAAPSPDALQISLSLETVVAGKEPAVRIIYGDNGPGVPREYCGQIFEDFFSRRPNQRIPGTGLGMGFVQRVIEAHAGYIVYSGQKNASDGPGAEFTIILPWSDDETMKEKNYVQNSDS